MNDVYDYNDRDDERLGDYDKAQVAYKRWKRGEPPLVLDGPFQRIKKTTFYMMTPHPTLKPIIKK